MSKRLSSCACQPDISALTALIRPARPDEASLVLRFIRELALYEKLPDEVTASEAEIAASLFCDNPRVFCDIAEWQGEPVGFAVWFYTYSTFSGRHGIWLEDLFVREAQRGLGLGKALMAGLARRCLEEDLTRLAWWVLDWNEPSRAFYRSLGAKAQDEWIVKRLDGEALAALARSG